MNAGHGKERSGSEHSRLMERVVARENAKEALKRVRRNKGSPGIDGMRVEELEPYLHEHWQTIREQLLGGSYRPSAVKRQLIPKSGGGMRQIGIPTVLDRFVQQLMLQVLQPIFDPTFSEHSHGFRPGRRAHDAVRKAQQYVQDGRRWVVDVDLEKFFDRVHHDVLMGKLHNRIADPRMLRIIRRYLEAGTMADGVVVERHEGTPQVGRSRRCLQTCSSTKWTSNWSDAGTALSATLMTAMFTCGRSGQASECWPRCGRCTRSSGSRSTRRRVRWRGCGTGSFWATASG
jgi:RNA-directed DNA polymerase